MAALTLSQARNLLLLNLRRITDFPYTPRPTFPDTIDLESGPALTKDLSWEYVSRLFCNKSIAHQNARPINYFSLESQLTLLPRR
jgi:hypothetical protein